MADRVGTAVLELVTDSSKFGSGLAQAEKDFGRTQKTLETGADSIQSRLSKVGTAIAAAFSFREVAAAAGKAMDLAGSIDDLARRTGISAEAVQELDFVAKQSGSTFDQVAGAIGQMANRLTEGDKGAVGALKAMGFSLKEVQAMAPDQAFQAIAERIAEIPDPMHRTAIAMDVFGKSGAQMLPVITSDIGGLRDVARETGVVISNELIAKGDALGDTWDQTQGRIQALMANAMLPLLDVFTEMPGPMQTAVAAGLSLAPALSNIGIAIMAAGGPTAAIAVLSKALIGMSALLTLPVGAVVAAVVAFVAIWQNWDTIGPIVKNVYEGVKTWLLDKFTSVIEGIRKKVESVTGFFQKMYDVVVGHSIVPDLARDVAAHFEKMRSDMDTSSKKAAAATVKSFEQMAAQTRGWIGTLEEMRFAEIAAAQEANKAWQDRTTTLQAAVLNMSSSLRTFSEDVRQSNYALRGLDHEGLIPTIDRTEELNQAWKNGAMGLEWYSRELGILGSQGVKVQGLSSTLKTAVTSSLGDLNNIFQAAFEGGGGIGGAVQSFATRTVSMLTNMIPVVGPILSQFSGMFVAAGKKIWGALSGLFGPDGQEKEGNQLADQFRASLSAALTEAQKLEAQAAVNEGANRAWAESTIAIRDAYIAAGRTESEALAIADALWRAQKQGGDAVKAVIQEISRVIDGRLTPATQTFGSTMSGVTDKATRDLEILTAEANSLNDVLAEPIEKVITVTTVGGGSGHVDAWRGSGLGNEGQSFEEFKERFDKDRPNGWTTNQLAEAWAQSMGDASGELLRQWGFDTEGWQGFAAGTPGLGFKNFGSGTPVVLHGMEAVVPQDMAKQFALQHSGDVIAMLASRLGALERQGRDLPFLLANAVRGAVATA
jgi:hypothetical protein